MAVGQGTFVTDSLGNSYLAALCQGGDTCVEKLSSDGKSLIFETSLNGYGSSQITLDTSGNVFILYGLPLNLAKLDGRGSVLGIVVVDEKGNPRDLKVIRALGLGLDQKAIEAVEKWRFKPGMKDGRAVPVQATIEVNFRLL